MKKLLIVSIMLLLLSGCSKGSSVALTNGSDLLWEGPKDSYTKQDLFDDMKNLNNYSSVISNSVLKTIAEVDGIDIEAEIKALEEQYDSYMEILGDYAVSYFGDKTSFVNTLLPDSIASRYMKNDVEANFDSYVKENNPYYGTIFYLTDKDMADDIYQMVKDGEHTLEYAATEAGYNDNVSASVYTDKSDLPVEVKEVILNNDAPYFGLLPVETFATSSDTITSSFRYYVINITSKDVSTFKDEFIELLSSDFDKTALIQELVDKHDVRFFDQTSYDSFSTVYEGAK